VRELERAAICRCDERILNGIKNGRGRGAGRGALADAQHGGSCCGDSAARVSAAGPLVFALHPAETVSVVKNYSDPELGMVPARPLAVDYQIETNDTWNYAIDTSTPPKFVAAASQGWSYRLRHTSMAAGILD
jgi:hypothetical protein